MSLPLRNVYKPNVTWSVLRTISTRHHRRTRVTHHDSWIYKPLKKREMASPNCKKRSYETELHHCWVCVCVCVCAASTALPAHETRRKSVGHFVYIQQFTVAAHSSRRQRAKRQKYVSIHTYPMCMLRGHAILHPQFVPRLFYGPLNCNLAKFSLRTPGRHTEEINLLTSFLYIVFYPCNI